MLVDDYRDLDNGALSGGWFCLPISKCGCVSCQPCSPLFRVCVSRSKRWSASGDAANRVQNLLDSGRGGRGLRGSRVTAHTVSSRPLRNAPCASDAQDFRHVDIFLPGRWRPAGTVRKHAKICWRPAVDSVATHRASPVGLRSRWVLGTYGVWCVPPAGPSAPAARSVGGREASRMTSRDWQGVLAAVLAARSDMAVSSQYPRRSPSRPQNEPGPWILRWVPLRKLSSIPPPPLCSLRILR